MGMGVVNPRHLTSSALYCLARMSDNSEGVCSDKQRMVGTLQDVHPDQLCSLWTTADLVFEEILRLEKGNKKVRHEKQQQVFHTLILQQLIDE